ncbi:MAG: hypothetical protein CMO80_24350 [Verrucomicrobiales bacterium]|nr:hypothetical protein [Verrucomicrobiales bacterium]|tara:strand:- start:7948 stop:8583 length:636 start_codon:yes stop_codon:yes gene_type:complete
MPSIDKYKFWRPTSVVIFLRHWVAVVLLAFLPGNSPAGESGAYPRVFRTFMPESGPSAFVVELSSRLALCYDPLRGGVNRIWNGGIDLSPTRLAKINNFAKIVGKEFYRETRQFPLRLGKEGPRPRFKGYRYLKDGIVFEFALGGQLVTETLRATKDGRGLVRELKLPNQAFFSLENQRAAEVTVHGGREVKPGQWQFEAGAIVRMVITPR